MKNATLMITAALLAGTALAGLPNKAAAPAADKKLQQKIQLALHTGLVQPLNQSLNGGRLMFSRMGPTRYYQTEIQGFASNEVPFTLYFYDRALALNPKVVAKAKAAGTKFIMPRKLVAQGRYNQATGKITLIANGRMSVEAFIEHMKKTQGEPPLLLPVRQGKVG